MSQPSRQTCFAGCGTFRPRSTILYELDSRLLDDIYEGWSARPHWRVNGELLLPEEMDLSLKIVRTYRPTGRVSIRRIGSFVNDVFLVKVDNEKLVAKRYTNWVSLKWVTLSLFGLGSVHFSISGKRRMEAEYAFNDLLSRRGIPVPTILGADQKSRTILFSFVPGDQLSSLLPRLASGTQT